MNPSGNANRLQHTNASTAITAGSVVLLVSGTSGFIGIAVADIAASTGTGAVEVRGVQYGVDKTTGQAWTCGQVLYWNPITSKYTTTSSSAFTRAGRAASAAGSSATTGDLSLNA
jgi:predicted RecA/RadA family phage recombinase